MVVHSAWANLYDFDSPDGWARLEAAERAVLADYSKHVVEELLARPIVVFRASGACCVVLFGELAFLGEDGGISVAKWRDGVLSDYDYSELELADGLPLRRSRRELKQLLFELAIPRLLSALSDWRGEPVDMRGSGGSAWSLGKPAGVSPDAVVSALRRCLDATPDAHWTELFNEMTNALEIDRTLAAASCWMLLGETDTAQSYKKLLGLAGVKASQRSHENRALIANALAASFAEGHKPESVDASVRWFRKAAFDQGVNRLGWHLLIGSRLQYWRQLMHAGYDALLMRLALLAGQAALPPQLPRVSVVRLLERLTSLVGAEEHIQNIPLQVWRTLLEVLANSSSTMMDAAEVLDWAARTGKDMPKTLRAARWQTLKHHAFEYSLAKLDESNASPGRGRHARIAKNGVVARRILSADGLQRVASIMQNCLINYQTQMESGEVILYFATRDEKRAVVMLHRSLEQKAWELAEISGPSNREADHCFKDLPGELCARWNSDSE